MNGPEEKLAYALQKKNEGNSYFSKGKYRIAIRKYKLVLDIFNYTTEFSEGELDECKKIKAVCHLNISACNLKLSKWKDALTQANEALVLDPKSPKGLWRRASAHFELGSIEKAEKDLKEALSLASGDKQIRELLLKVQRVLREEKKKEEQMAQSILSGL